jgi:hypothetical protein
MIILDKPFISQQLQQTILRNQFPVLIHHKPDNFQVPEGFNVLDKASLINYIQQYPDHRVYCNSENSIEWIVENLAFTKLPDYIQVFKDKVTFRKMISTLYPAFHFQEVSFEQLHMLAEADIPYPCIIKPSVGFHSTGVYRVDSPSDWARINGLIRKEMQQMEGVYPKEVMNASQFILEELIEGEEYAIDVYFNSEGKPVILNILHHIFSSADDVSDRVYITSGKLIRQFHTRFTEMLQTIGAVGEVRNFSCHVEVRVTPAGVVVPIEVNPTRFAGWCCTDLSQFAYGINTYECYLKQLQPDWDEILKDNTDRTYALIVGDVPKTIQRNQIESVDYDAFLGIFSKPLDIRKVDFTQYPIFAFLFAEVKPEEIDRMLRADLAEFIKLKNQ